MASVATSEAETYLLNNRTQDEHTRLGVQHTFIQYLRGNNIVDPSIDKSKINAVADVGTGTGAWLLQAFNEFGAPGATDRNFVGFDISAAQFPKQDARNISFIVHDVNEPFAPEHIGMYDLVHLRFLVLALPISAYPKVVENVVALLKPGGLIQWTDYDHEHVKSQPDAIFGEISDFMRNMIIKHGMVLDAPGEVRTQFEAAGLVDVVRTDYSDGSCRVPFELYREWYDAALKTLVRHLLTRDEQPEKHNGMEAKAERIILAAKSAHERGLRSNSSVSDVVARKPLN